MQAVLCIVHCNKVSKPVKGKYFCLCMISIIMRPSSLGGGRILRRTLSVRPSRYSCLSVRLSVRPVSGCTLFTVAPSYERTSKIEKLRFSLMGQRHVCTFRHA